MANRKRIKELREITDDVLDLHFYEHLSVSQISAKLNVLEEDVRTIVTWSWRNESPAKYYLKEVF